MEDELRLCLEERSAGGISPQYIFPTGDTLKDILEFADFLEYGEQDETKVKKDSSQKIPVIQKNSVIDSSHIEKDSSQSIQSKEFSHCIICGTSIPVGKTKPKKYCSNKCQQQYKRNNKK